MAEIVFQEYQAGEAIVLDMSGRITFGDGTVELRDEIHRLLEKGERKILLNLAGVSYVDSSGIGELVAAFASVRRTGGQLKLVHVTQSVKFLLDITKLLTVFDTYDDEVEAINDFKP